MSILKRLWSAFELSKTDSVTGQFLIASLSFNAGFDWLGWVWLALAVIHYAANVLSPD